MEKQKQKPHDLRDDIYAPSTTVTNTGERLAGAEPSSVDPEKGDFVLVTPDAGKGIPDGQTSKG